MGAARRAQAQAVGVRRASGGVRTGAGGGVARAAAAGVRARARDGGRAGWLVAWGDVGRRACMALCLCGDRCLWVPVQAWSLASVCVAEVAIVSVCVSVAVCGVARLSSVVTDVCVCVACVPVSV